MPWLPGPGVGLAVLAARAALQDATALTTAAPCVPALGDALDVLPPVGLLLSVGSLTVWLTVGVLPLELSWLVTTTAAVPPAASVATARPLSALALIAAGSPENNDIDLLLLGVSRLT